MRRILLLALLPGMAAAQQTLEGDPTESLGVALLVADLDGDGAAEVVASAPRHTRERNHYQGRVVVVRGGPGDLERRSATWLGPRSGAQAGSALAAGDVNGDGFPELAIGADKLDRGQGAVFVLKGSRGGGVLAGGLLGTGSELMTLRGTGPAAGLGHAVALGDLDGDGLAELAVSAPTAAGGAGRVLVFRGARKPPRAATEVGPEGGPAALVVSGREHQALGTGLLLADVDGDGLSDLVMLSPFQPSGRARAAGSVAVVRGRKDLLGKKRTIDLDEEDPDLLVTGPGEARLGSAAAVADADGDGRPELLLGASHFHGRRAKEGGAVFAVDGSATGRIDLGKEAPLLRGLAHGEHLGAALATGAGHLVVGAPAANRVAIFALPLGATPRPVRALMESAPGRLAYGTGVGVGDLDGDGSPEIVVAAPGAGRIYLQPLSAR